jgi:hypothetical protein
MTVMNKPVYYGTGHLLIEEYAVPMAELKISGNNNAAFLIIQPEGRFSWLFLISQAFAVFLIHRGYI